MTFRLDRKFFKYWRVHQNIFSFFVEYSHYKYLTPALELGPTHTPDVVVYVRQNCSSLSSYPEKDRGTILLFKHVNLVINSRPDVHHRFAISA